MKVNNPISPGQLLLIQVKKQLATAKYVGRTNGRILLPINKEYTILGDGIFVKTNNNPLSYAKVAWITFGEIISIKEHYPTKALKKHIKMKIS